MEITISHINIDEAARYLGLSGKDIPEETMLRLSALEKELLETATPRAISKWNGDREVVFAATLGASVDKLISRYQVTNMADAVMLDALASAMIEQVVDKVDNAVDIATKKQDTCGKVVFGKRFSPGYGDFPLEAQKEILEFLDAPKQIGLTLTSGNMLSPVKSVTAIVRRSDGEGENEPRGSCDTCDIKQTCRFRKGGCDV